MKFSFYSKGLIVLLLLVFMFSCTVNEDFSPDDQAVLSLKIMDAPGDYEKVFIDLSEVHLMVIDDESDPNCWWRLMSTNPGVYDLHELIAGNEVSLLNRVNAPSGSIYAIKLVLGDNNYVIKNGQRIDLFTNVIQLDNLKMRTDTNFIDGKDYEFLVDIDASRSIVKGPLDDQLILRPIVRYGFKEQIGAVKGRIQNENGSVYVHAVKGLDTITTLSNNRGEFSLRVLQPGTYDIFMVNSESGKDDYEWINQVQVMKNNTFDLGTLSNN